VLSLSGNSEQAFASLNSIQANPQVWVEWNYNEISKPYVVYSNASNPLNAASALEYRSNWDAVGISRGKIYNVTSGGYKREVDSDSSAVVLEASTGNSESFSASVAVNGPGYYKLVFYARADIQNVYGATNKVNDSVSISGSSSGGTSTYYYRVIPRSRSYGQIQFDATGSDSIIGKTSSSSLTLRWFEDDNALAYDIYRGTTKYITPYLATVAAHVPNAKIDYDYDMTHFDQSSWNVSSSIAITASVAPAVTVKNGYTTKPKSMADKDVLESDLEFINKTKKNTVGGIEVTLPRNWKNSTTASGNYTASVTNVLARFFSDNDTSTPTRFSVDTELLLQNGTTHTFAVKIRNGETVFSDGPVTLKTYVYSNATTGGLLDTITSSVSSSALTGQWYTLSNTFTASTGTYVMFELSSSAQYRFAVPSSRTKKQSKFFYPLAIDVAGLWQRATAPSWKLKDPDNIFYKISTQRTKYVYQDDLTIAATSIAPPSYGSFNFYMSPSIKLSKNGNYLESTKYFTRMLDQESKTPVVVSNSVEIDGAEYQMIEVFFGSEDDYDTMELDINLTTATTGARMLFSKPEIFKIDSWNFMNWEYFPIESPFYPNRPGEALLNPFLPSKDRTVTLPNSSSVAKPVSNVFYNTNSFAKIGYPYKQSILSKYNRFKYYLSDNDPVKDSTVIRAQYNDYLNINKLIVKASNALVDMTTTSGSVKLLGPGNAVLNTIAWGSGDFDSSGVMVLYYDGANWSTSRGTWNPPKLTDSGILQNVSASVTGVVFIHNGATVASNRANRLYSAVNKKPEIRSHIIEISPRLEIDISDLIETFTTTKAIDNQDSVAGFPLGYMNANTGGLDIHNIPVIKNTFPFTMFDQVSENATFANLMRQNVKFTVMMVSPSLDFTDEIPFMTMYSDSWNVSGLDKVSVNLFDMAKGKMMAMEDPDYFAWEEDLYSTVTNLLDFSGISDYDNDAIKRILLNKSNKTSYFWCEKKGNVFDTLKSLFVSQQIGAAFDEYGVMRFFDLDDIISRYTGKKFTPDFAITDVPLKITTANGPITYESNIMQNSYNPTMDSKVGKIIVQYRVANKNISVDTSQSNNTRKTTADMAAWQQKDDLGLPDSFIARTVNARDNSMFATPALAWSPGIVHILGGYSGYGFVGGELISWNGLEFSFTPKLSPDAGQLQSISRVLFSDKDADVIVQDILASNPDIVTVDYAFTGKVTGVARGQKFTSVRNHYMYDDGKNIPTGYVSPTDDSLTQYFDKISISGVTPSASSTSLGGNVITFDKNVASIIVRRQEHTSTRKPSVLLAKGGGEIGDPRVPYTASKFKFFSTKFVAPDFTKNHFGRDDETILLEVGFYIGHQESPLMVGIRNNGKHSFVALNDFSRTTTKPYKGAAHNQRDSAASSKLASVNNVFDGKEHRLSIKLDDSELTVWVDNELAGTWNLCTPRGSSFSRPKRTNWGVYVDNLSKKNGPNAGGRPLSDAYHVNITEMYAVDDALGKHDYGINPKRNTFHHWRTQKFLDLLLEKNVNAEPNYYFWSGPKIPLHGAHFYEDQEFNTAPAQPFSLVSLYTGYNPGGTKGKASTLSTVLPWRDVTISSIYANPFRFSLGIVNKSNQLVFIASADNKIEEGSVPNIQLNGAVFVPGEQATLEKVINAANVNNSITLTTDWIQSEENARQLIDRASRLANTFNVQIDLDIFGNPLIQVGDICQFVYTLKGIGYDPENQGVIPKYYLVKSVKQDFTGGLKTSISMRPMFDLKYDNIS